MQNPYSQLYQSLNLKIAPETSSEEAESLIRQLGLLYNTIGVVMKDVTRVLGYRYGCDGGQGKEKHGEDNQKEKEKEDGGGDGDGDGDGKEPPQGMKVQRQGQGQGQGQQQGEGDRDGDGVKMQNQGNVRSSDDLQVIMKHPSNILSASMNNPIELTQKIPESQMSPEIQIQQQQKQQPIKTIEPYLSPSIIPIPIQQTEIKSKPQARNFNKSQSSTKTKTRVQVIDLDD